MRILVPVDLAISAPSALAHAAKLSRERGAPLCLVHAIPPTKPTPFAGLLNARALRLSADKLRDRATELGFDVDDCTVVQGEPAEVIARAAAPDDLIVMKALPRRGWSRVHRRSLIGNVAQRAPCPILVVPRGREASSSPE